MKSWDSVWEEVFSSREWGKYPSESIVRFVASKFFHRERKNVRLLEVGCGTGANIWFMCKEGFDVFGIDGSKSAIEKSYKMLGDAKLNATLFVGDIVSLPFEDNSFDGIVDSECLYCNNTTNTQKILSEIQRVLKQYGFFY